MPNRCTANSADEDAERDRQHIRLERRRDDFQAFHRAQHRDGRRDDAVAVEQRRAEDAEQQQGELGAAASSRPPWRPGPSSAMMPPSPRLSARRISTTYFSVTTNISPQKMTDTAPMRLAASSGTPVRGVEDFLHRVQRAGADVAVHHAQGAEGQAPRGFRR